jgi:hypothetical protein
MSPAPTVYLLSVFHDFEKRLTPRRSFSEEKVASDTSLAKCVDLRRGADLPWQALFQPDSHH